MTLRFRRAKSRLASSTCSFSKFFLPLVFPKLENYRSTSTSPRLRFFFSFSFLALSVFSSPVLHLPLQAP